VTGKKAPALAALVLENNGPRITNATVEVIIIQQTKEKLFR